MLIAMKSAKVLPILLLLLAGLLGPSWAAPVESRNFLSPLHYSGSLWQVKSDVGPVYLARREGGVWRVLACFDGTKGKYVLEWRNPHPGIYAAIDSNGACSELVQIGERPAR
ncbi:MAG: hypothetical protein JNL92_04540 [Opitutaceae bacterium]|nr:hypothetical protein [Opitutaceae bacterium]